MTLYCKDFTDFFASSKNFAKFEQFFILFFLGTPLGYNLAVNTAMHAAATAARPVQPSPNTSLTVPGQGNCQPGYPVRPSEANTITSNLLNSNNPAGVVRPGHNEAKKSEGHPGHIQRTDYSPDTTTKDLPPVQVSHQHHPTYLSQDQQTQQVNFNFSVYRPGQPNWGYTMWKFQDFSTIQILREIILGHFEAPKTAMNI